MEQYARGSVCVYVCARVRAYPCSRMTRARSAHEEESDGKDMT